jgi:hypothetical protein
MGDSTAGRAATWDERYVGKGAVVRAVLRRA